MSDLEITESVRDKQNLETAKMDWKDLQKFFAQGNLVLVDASLDLMEVAEVVAEDNAVVLKKWMKSGLVGEVTDAQAKYFFAHEAVFWTTVVKPFILIQKL